MSEIKINLKRLSVPDNMSFHGSIIKYNENKYICIYHNSGEHCLASCFVTLDDNSNFTYIEGTHTANLGIYKYIDPRLIKYKDKYYLSVSRLLVGPEKIYLWLLDINDKITINKQYNISFTQFNKWPSYKPQREKNWTPWEYDGKFLYTYSLNPHKILEIDVNNNDSTQLIAETSWESYGWWDNQKWVDPIYRLNTPPLLLPDGTYLSVFHSMRMSSLNTPWHRIQPNDLLSYWTGFYLFEGKPPFRVLRISKSPFMTPDFILPSDWPFQPPPSGGNPFYPFNLMLRDDKIILAGGSNEVAIAYCNIPLNDILNSLSPVITIS